MFEEVLAEKTDVTHEDMSQRIVRETEIGDIISFPWIFEIPKLAISPSEDRERRDGS